VQYLGKPVAQCYWPLTRRGIESEIRQSIQNVLQGEQMKIQGLSIHIERHGEGNPAIIFLHYWGGSSRTWRRVAAELQNKFQTVAYDARGWGKSDKASAGYALNDLADEVLALVREVEINEFVLVGHSLGGKIAQLAASRRPKGLLGLVLVAPAPPTPLRFPEEMRETQIHAYDKRENVLQTIRLLSARMPPPEIVEQIVEDSMSGSPAATMAYPTSSILEDISSEVPKIAVPTLVLAGELDQLDSIEQHKREVLARIVNARLEIIPRSGHLIPIDEPEELAKHIEKFVSALQQ
jgi:3-oxoadipate enol-lactonase